MATSKRHSLSVYFVESLSTGLIKIGYTRQIDVRLKNLKAGHHGLILLALAKGGRRREAEIHETLGRFRIEGEWFAPSPLVLEYIAVNGSMEGHYSPPVVGATVRVRVKYKGTSLRLDPDLWASFREIANDNGQSIVGRLRTMVRRDVEAAARAEVVPS